MIVMNNPYVSFAASKMSNNPKFSVTVEFTDFLGKVHRIVCNNRKKLAEANEFLKMFKAESLKISKILNEYPVVKGQYPKKYHSEIKAELSANGFGSVANYIVKYC
jgi:hypothetical protein